jgi:hypothetical protein
VSEFGSYFIEKLALDISPAPDRFVARHNNEFGQIDRIFRMTGFRAFLGGNHGRLRRWVVRALLGIVALVAFAAYSVLSPESWLNRSSAIAATLEWGRLAPFPSSAKHLSISTSGGMFSRAFRVYFDAPEEDIDRWLQQSPGTRELMPTSPSPGIRHFQIEAGGGAEWAEVTVDDTAHSVSIYVYWS